MGSIYIIKNNINNKVYIGQTKQNIKTRFSQHKCDAKRRNTSLYCAMSKYGTDSFYVELLEDDIPYEQLDEKEIYYIALYNSIAPNGYNISEGGKAYRTEEELKK